MKCKCGEFECPYVEESNGQCCIPKKCPEWQSYNDTCDAMYEFNLKTYINWIETQEKIAEDLIKNLKKKMMTLQ